MLVTPVPVQTLLRAPQKTVLAMFPVLLYPIAAVSAIFTVVPPVVVAVIPVVDSYDSDLNPNLSLQTRDNQSGG
jgi:hypothetical protein